MNVFGSNRYAIGLNSKVKLNSSNGRIYFGNVEVKDKFRNNSSLAYFNEDVIRDLIASNPELRAIMKENKIPKELNLVELKDLQENHLKDTQNVALGIVQNLPSSLKQKVDVAVLKEGAMLHDIGKVLIPKEILNKPGALTPEEHKIMDLHTELGYQLLKNTDVNPKVLNLIRYHHFNNNKDIVPDLNLQILNLADKFSALSEQRVYKNKYTLKQALTIIYKEDVKTGNVHPFIFNALVKSVANSQISEKVKKC